jgi:hypothetical protein
MKKRQFLVATAAAGLIPAVAPAFASPSKGGPTVLTVGGSITRTNRGPVDKVLDQLMARHGVEFAKAFTFDAAALQQLPRIDIRPTLEYDNERHKLTGPLLTTVLHEAGVDTKAEVRIGLRAIDGYNVVVSLAQIHSYRMIIATHADDQALALGGLGPQWAVHEADALAAFKDKPLKERFALCPWGLYYIDVASI